MPGADKIIKYDPPGAIGLIDVSPIIMLRFNEIDNTELPVDDAGSLLDLDTQVAGVVTGVTLATPIVVPGSVGRARHFVASTTGYSTRDKVPGSTLLTRDMSVQVIMSWDAATQPMSNAGNIISRGFGGAGAEGLAFALQIELVSAATFTGTLQWVWQNTAGTTKIQTGAQFTMTPGQFSMLTATRRWISPTSVALNYYIGDQLIGTVASIDGVIGGGTTGATQVGSRSISAANTRFLAGDIDEIMVVDRELCLEEIEATWLRITQYQPRATAMFIEHHDDGFPMPDNPASDAQLDNRMAGQALGLAAAAAENLRANFLPQRAYGTTLEQWEETVRVTSAPTTDIAVRRSRVLARLSQRLGSSLDGFRGALAELIGAATPAQLEFLAFTNTITDDFATLNLSRWDVTPVGAFAAVSGAARVAPGAGTFSTPASWKTCAAAVGGDGVGAHIIAKMVFTTPATVAEAGVHFGDVALGNYLLLGLRDTAGVFTVCTESYVLGVSQGLVTQATLGGNPAAIWFHLWQTDTPGSWLAAWSLTSATAGYTTSSVITHPTLQNRAGFYLRAGTAGAPVVDFDDLILRAPGGTRPFNAYVLLDRTLGFSPDINGARSVVAAIKHAFVNGTFITTRTMLCDDIDGGCDWGPMGGI